jgi:hypothetical protein
MHKKSKAEQLWMPHVRHTAIGCLARGTINHSTTLLTKVL